MSDIRVFVTFSQPGGAVFAGETLECKIVFKNVSPSAASNRPQPPPLSVLNGHGDRRTRPSNLSVAQVERTRASVVSSRSPQPPPATPALHTRRQSLSVPFNAPPKSPIRPSTSSQLPPPTPVTPTPTAVPSTPIINGEATPTQPSTQGKGHKHKRSISIISIGGSDAVAEDVFPRQQQTPLSTRRPGLKGHGRSASLQIPPRRNGQAPGGTPLLPSTTWPARPSQPGTPSTPSIREGQEVFNGSFTFPPPPSQPARRASAANFSGPITPLTPATPSIGGRGKGLGINNAFKFPASPSTPTSNPNPPIPEQEPSQEQPTVIEATSLNPPPKSITNIDLKSNHEDSESEVAGPTSSIAAIRNLNNLETPRSSSDFYSHPNSTTDTLVSEYDRVSQTTSKVMRPAGVRRHSLLGMATKQPETLMMGYAQVSGSFVLDGSLMQTALFDEVKRKGIVGGQRGGGVVGIDTKKNSEGGFLGGWGGFGLSGLLGGGNMSTIAEMKSIASSKSIPILSTPQSILFVDLRLAPGESKTYSYSFLLPETLPPSHRGKAIKITYNLVIGTQRPGKGVQHPKTVEIPFRVFPYVKPNGTLYHHDLMSPIIRLRDIATTTCLDEDSSSTSSTSSKQLTQPPAPRKANEPTMNDFLHYVGSLMAPRTNTPLTGQSLGVPFAQALPTPIRPSMSEEITSKDAIEATILRSGYSQGGRGGLFEIARNGRRVASLTLSRPAYKLGETITAVINFNNAEIPCYHIHSSLETSESVDPALALRSPASIHRATRRIHSHHFESTIFSKRVTLTPTIPATASPEFSTSGISVAWHLRIEFITPVLDMGEQFRNEELLELTSNDSRGEIWEARQGLYVESFDAAIPVKVYPNPSEMGFAGGQPPVTGFVV